MARSSADPPKYHRTSGQNLLKDTGGPGCKRRLLYIGKDHRTPCKNTGGGQGHHLEGVDLTTGGTSDGSRLSATPTRNGIGKCQRDVLAGLRTLNPIAALLICIQHDASRVIQSNAAEPPNDIPDSARRPPGSQLCFNRNGGEHPIGMVWGDQKI